MIALPSGYGDQGILTNNRRTQREFKLKYSTFLKAYDVKYIKNSKNNFLKHQRFKICAPVSNIS